MFFYEMEHLIAFGLEEVTREETSVIKLWIPWVANHMEHTEPRGERIISSLTWLSSPVLSPIWRSLTSLILASVKEIHRDEQEDACHKT